MDRRGLHLPDARALAHSIRPPRALRALRNGARADGDAAGLQEARDETGLEHPAQLDDKARLEHPAQLDDEARPDDEARLLPFPVRMQNLSHVVGQGLEHPMFLDLYDMRYQLGDHDYASGVASDLRWSAERMQYWVRGLKPVCTSTEMQAAYPDLLTDPRPLMRTAWGHEPSEEEVQSLADLQGGSLPPEDQYMVTCVAVLTALDFVSI